ncbi:MAG: T9SS type A sorting domain-containing protein, partial [Bacteroidales bacterium]|nr:T9SS type A sorting domain-containing protein [Bacteroidales bacterium]
RLNISDPDNIQSETVITQGVPVVSEGLNIIKWDPARRQFYWAFAASDGASHLRAYSIDLQTNILTSRFANDNLSTGVFDIEFTTNNGTDDAFYVSRLGGVEAYSAVTFNSMPIFSYTYPIQTGNEKKFFVKKTETGFNMLFCLPFDNNSSTNGQTTVINTDLHQAIASINHSFKSVCSAAIFETTNKLVIGTSPYEGNDIRIIDTHPPYGIIQSLDTDSFDDDQNNPNSMLFSGNSMYVSKVNEIIKLTLSQETYSFVPFEEGFKNFYHKGLVGNSNKLFFINQVRSGIEKLESQLHSDFHQTGTMAYESVYYPDANKIVLFSKLKHDNSTLVMVDATTYGSPLVFDFESPIGDCKYNKYSGDLLVLTHENNNTYLQKFDPATNSFSNVLNVNQPYCSDMYISPQQKLYITSNMRSVLSPVIVIYDANNYNLKKTQNLSVQTYTSDVSSSCDFTFNKATKDVYFTIYHNKADIDPATRASMYGVLGKFEGNYDYTELATTYSNPKHIQWARYTKRADNYGECYFINAGKLYVWDCNNDIQEAEINGSNESFLDIAVDEEKQNVYALTRHGVVNKTGRVYSVGSNNSLSLLAEFGTEGVTGLENNPHSHELMAFTRCNASNLSGMYVLKPEESNPTVTFTSFNNTHFDFMGSFVRQEPGICFNTATNQAIIPNGGYSNFTVMDYVPRDRILLLTTVNWISVPRHLGNTGQNDYEPWPTDEVFTQSSVEDGFATLNLSYNLVNPSDLSAQIVHADYDENEIPVWDYWVPEYLSNIKSIEGYKLEYTPGYESKYFWMEGNVEDEETQIPVYADNDNWVGYFLEEEQDIFDALFGANILSSLTEIRGNVNGMDYYCYKSDEVIWDGPTYGGVTATPWICDQTNRTIRYGGMAMLTAEETADFQWQNSGYPTKKEHRPVVEYFQYEETSSYTPIIIELDYPLNPLELGAFIDTICVGAVALLPEDTAVILRAYLEEGYAPDDIVFQEYFANKSSQNNVVDNYSVFNERTRNFEKRSLKGYVGSSRVYISFKNKGEQNSQTATFNIAVWPNPSAGQLNYELYMPETGRLKITLTDISGKTLSVPVDKNYPEGNLSGTILLTDTGGNLLSPGLYFMSISVNGVVTTKKIIVE